MAPQKKNTPEGKLIVKEKLLERKKQAKLLLKEKRARLIIRNLPFKATEENLKEYFEKYGEIVNVELLKKPDGKLVGCGFIQFKLVQKAAKAKHHTNGKPFLGRDVLVDFAQSLDKYKKELKKTPNPDEVEVKEEPIEVEEPKVEDDDSAVKESAIVDDSDEEKIKSDDSDNSDSEKDESEEENSENEEKNDSDEDVKEVKSEERKPHVVSNDVTEGKTIFIKNVPFSATNEDLKQCMYQFGSIYYALICIDRMTEHSKGTAFVKFQYAEDAEKALKAGTELTLLGNVLDCHPALARNDVQKKIADNKEHKNEPKDSRNLYLVKEGVILAGTKAAEGVSASDMAKRLQLEQYKTQMLRNLNMFISKERLVVHNLPATWDDLKLRTLLQKFGGPGAVIREARVMRDMKILDANGVGKTKEFGFVAFTRHEHALNALRSLNNNPNVFSAAKRPIVTFSIENKSMIKAKQKRLEKSQLRNPINKQYNPNKSQTVENKKFNFNKNKTFDKGGSNQVNKQISGGGEGEDLKGFTGITAKPGKQKMRSRYKLSTQAKLHFENIKKEKKKLKNTKKSLAVRKQDFTKQPKQKVNKQKNKESDNFSKLVNEYKKKLTSAPDAKKAKWYDSNAS